MGTKKKNSMFGSTKEEREFKEKMQKSLTIQAIVAIAIASIMVVSIPSLNLSAWWFFATLIPVVFSTEKLFERLAYKGEFSYIEEKNGYKKISFGEAASNKAFALMSTLLFTIGGVFACILLLMIFYVVKAYVIKILVVFVIGAVLVGLFYWFVTANKKKAELIINKYD